MDLRRNMKHTVLVYMLCHYTRTLKCVHLVGNFFNEMYLFKSTENQVHLRVPPFLTACFHTFLIGTFYYLVRVPCARTIGSILFVYRVEVSCACTGRSLVQVQMGVSCACMYRWEYISCASTLGSKVCKFRCQL
jgi:hypothetical protein